MIVSIYTMLFGVSMCLIGIGFLIKSKVVIYGGAVVMMIIGLIPLAPINMDGKIEYISGYIDTLNATTNVTVREYTYTELPNIYQISIGVLFLCLSLFLSFVVFMDKELD